MIRINVIVEGPTEEAFIKNVIAPYFEPHETFVIPCILGVPGHKGGNVNYARVKKDVVLQLKQDRAVYCSTMFDLYGLGSGFHSSVPSLNLNGLEKAACIEKQMHTDIVETVPELRPHSRFIPYLQVHEYEALLFSDPEKFANALGGGPLHHQLRNIRDAFQTPEDINDNPNKAPSKRISTLYPPYKKVIEGTFAALSIGLTRIREECPHFDGWIQKLESLAPLTG